MQDVFSTAKGLLSELVSNNVFTASVLMLCIQGIREKSNVLHDMVSVELAHTLATVCTDTFHYFPCLYLLLMIL